MTATPSESYFDGVRRHAAGLGSATGHGTVIVADPDRAGSGSATAYPGRDVTYVFADAGVADLLEQFVRERPITTDDFVAAAVTAGAERLGIGHQRVLDGDPVRPEATAGDVTFRLLDRDDPADRSRLTELLDACGPDDVDEADIDLDVLDPVVVVGHVDDGRLVTYASGRPWELVADFDDIGVLTHPGFRGRRLGALAVHEYIVQQRRTAPERHPLYRCSEDNLASNRVAESLGFTLIQRIGAVRFPPSN